MDSFNANDSQSRVPTPDLDPRAAQTPPLTKKPVVGWTFKRAFLFAFFLGGAICAGIATGIIVAYLGEIPLVSDLKAYRPSLATKIYDVQGDQITELFSEQRTLIGYADIPKHLEQALIAIEDRDFYQHFGIQIKGILRSIIVNYINKGYQQGGSTITQQLARNMFLTQRKTIERKIKEIILALQIERTYTKREIMEMYLNQIYFGNGAYGVESAARVYFGKHTRDLNLQECALLAGLPRSPNTYNPYRTPDKAKERRDLVLSEMKKLGFISSQEADQAAQSKIELSSVESSEAAYFVEYVRKQLEDKYGSNAIYKTGLKVFTTLDLAVQRKAQDAMDTGILEAEKLILPGMQKVAGAKPETVQCALVVIDPASGEIKAMIGGRDFRASKFNRAVQAQRQPGSAFKPFVYATAISQGFTQADVILDTPLVFKDASGHVWKPENFTNRFYGPTCLRKALTKSINIVTVKLMEKVGVRSVIDLASKLGVQSPLNPYLTLALGASEVTLLELASAYGTFPNHGVHVEPFSIKRVETMAGEILEENTPFRQEAVDENTAAIMVDMMENVVNQGTGYAVRRLGFKYPAAGKTGTTNDFTDAWFLGYTSDYVAGVWIGLDSHRSMGRNITGGLVACPIWANFMVNLYKDRTAPEFKKPATIEYTNFCSISGLLPNPECQKFVMRGAFAIGSAPTQYCDIHTASRLAESMLGGDAQEPMDAETTAADDDESADSPAPSKANPSEKSSPPAPVRNDRPLMF